MTVNSRPAPARFPASIRLRPRTHLGTAGLRLQVRLRQPKRFPPLSWVTVARTVAWACETTCWCWPPCNALNAVVDRIGQALPEVVALSHAWGCSQIGADLEQTRRVLEEFAGHPNVGAVLLIGLGCETMPTQEMAEKLVAGGVLCRRLTIQEEGGSRATLARRRGRRP